MPSASPAPLSAASVAVAQWTAIAVGVQMALYGIHAAAFIISLSVLFHYSPNNVTLRVATTTIFLCASVAFVGTVPYYLLQVSLFRGPASPGAIRTGNAIMVSNIVAQRVMLFVADLIAAWRAWVVWMRRKRVGILLAVCLLGVVICSAGEVTLYVQSKNSGNPDFGQPVRIIFSIVPGLIANLVCTLLVGYRTWSYRRLAKAGSVASGRTTPNRIERVLVLLAESGALYVAFFAILLAMYLNNYFSDAKTSGAAMVLQVSLGEIVAVIPTLVIIAVALQRSQADPFVSTVSGGVVLSRSIHFRSGPSSRRSLDDEETPPEYLSVAGSWRARTWASDEETSPTCEEFDEALGSAGSTAVAAESAEGILLRPMGASRSPRVLGSLDTDATVVTLDIDGGKL